MILVTVIVPYFKKKKFIEKTINSIKSQTYKNLEIIVIYDDEDHADLTLIKKIKNSDKRIRLIINKKSLGAGRSRNVGINQARANYIAFLDADDFWKKNKIEHIEPERKELIQVIRNKKRVFLRILKID